MNETLTMLRDAAARTSELVRSVREDELALPTPCADYDVKGLLNHMEWGATLFEGIADDGGVGRADGADGTGAWRVRRGGRGAPGRAGARPVPRAHRA